MFIKYTCVFTFEYHGHLSLEKNGLTKTTQFTKEKAFFLTLIQRLIDWGSLGRLLIQLEPIYAWKLANIFLHAFLRLLCKDSRKLDANGRSEKGGRGRIEKKKSPINFLPDCVPLFDILKMHKNAPCVSLRIVSSHKFVFLAPKVFVTHS